MLRKLDVRTRLVTVIAVPLALLLAVALPELLRRDARAGEADTAAALVGLSGEVSGAVDALQGERVLSAASRAGAADRVDAALADQRAVTDDAVTQAQSALQRVALLSPGLREVATVAGKRLDTLGAIRDQTDAAQSIVTWIDPFGPVLDSLLVVEEDLGSAVADEGMGDELTQAGLVARAKEAAAAQSAQLAAASAWGELRGDQRGILASLRADELAYRTAYLAATPPALRVDRRAEVQQRAVSTAGRAVDDVIAHGDVMGGGGLLDWLDVGTERHAALRDVESARAADALRSVTALGDASRSSSTAYGALAGIGLLLAAGLAVLAARSITRPLGQLTDAADQLATDRLPKLVDALRNPGEDDERYLAATVEPIDVRSDDELARLARAFNSVQAVAVDVAAKQSELLRKGISDLYVNLARRNQALIERQIQLLDRLESEEQNPQVLEHLFLLDHLATRMRRNAESLLVLAGADTSPRRARPIDVVDVVRASLSEVEDYERVVLGTLATATVHGPAVSDVAHIVAELLDNAIHFSAPDTSVRIDGTRAGGSYQLVIIDEGVGMPGDQVAELNAIFERPPVTGLALGRSLGCLVAARLAARHGISVRLQAFDGGGVTATVVLPRSLLTIDEQAPARHPDVGTLAALDAQVPIVPVLPIVPEVRTQPEPEPAFGASAPGGELPRRLRDAVPVAAAFEAGLQSLLDDDSPAELVERAVSPWAPRDAAPRTDAAGDDTTEATSADVVEDDRVPAWSEVGHDAVPGSAPPEQGAAPRAALARRVPGAAVDGFEQKVTGDRVRRSPDEVRSLLSKYRAGQRAGRATGTGRVEEER